MKHTKFVTKTVLKKESIECDICGYKEENGSQLHGIWWKITGIDKKTHQLYSDNLELKESENYSKEEFDYCFDICNDCMLKIFEFFPLKNKGVQ